MQKAVFLDRDGVINSDDGYYYVSKPDDFILNPGIFGLLTWLKNQGFLLIVVSNQGGISKGVYTKNDTDRVHAKMIDLFKTQGIELEEIYYCPHHPENERCICRKPGTVQIEKAIARFSLSSRDSFFIGDRETDMEAGKAAGLKCIMVERNQDMSLLIGVIKKEMGIS